MPDASMDEVLTVLRAAAETTRLRLLVLCARGELTVSELAQILGQSQPRVSRHLKLLCEAGLLDRFREGSWVFYRLSSSSATSALSRHLVAACGDADETIALDLQRLAAIKRQRAELAAAYFRENAEQWHKIRSLYVDEREVEAALVEIIAQADPRDLLDIGTGTGRMIEILGAAGRQRPWHRSVARDARHRPGQPRTRRARQQHRTARRHVPVAPRRCFVRRGGDPPGLALCRPAGRRAGRGGAGVAPGRHPGGRRFRAARARIPARGACPSPARLRRCRGRRMVPRRRPRPRSGAAPAGRSADRRDLDGARRKATADQLLPEATRPARPAAALAERVLQG